MPKYKDKSNQRIMEMIEIIAEKMAEEGRGFIFAPIAKPTGNHRTMCAVVFPNIEEHRELGALEFMEFWATMSSIIANFNSQLSEDQRKVFREGFVPFCQTTTDQAFPKIKLIKMN